MTQAAVAVGARDVAVFAGRLSRDELGLGERAITRLVHAPYGDYRDWPAILAWSRSIAVELAGEPAASRTRGPADGLANALTGGAS
jgi:menaquinone-dependent protoporphyrinogen oxidase